MIDYEWTCNACSVSNPRTTDICLSCRCSATASSEEIEQHIDPEGYKKKQASKQLTNKVATLLYFPCFLIVFAINGRLEILLVALAVLAFSLKSNWFLIETVWKSTWYRNALVISSIYIFVFVFLRIFLNELNIAVGIYVVIWLFSILAIYYMLFKSQHAKGFFEEYYRQNDS
jgi:hypothetical protein